MPLLNPAIIFLQSYVKSELLELSLRFVNTHSPWHLRTNPPGGPVILMIQISQTVLLRARAAPPSVLGQVTTKMMGWTVPIALNRLRLL